MSFNLLLSPMLLTFVLLLTKPLVSEAYSDETICAKLHNRPKDFHLESLTYNTTSKQIWLMESKQMYFIPFDHLDATTDVLRLYNRTTNEPLKTGVQWSHIDWLRLLEYKDHLQWLAILQGKYRFYRFWDTYYVMQDGQDVSCDSFDEKLMPWNLTTMIHPNGRAELWVGLKQVGRVRRVIITAMEMKVVSTKDNGCNTVEFNFPGEETGLFRPVPPKFAQVFLETDATRSTITLVPSSQSSHSNYDEDLFVMPPAVLTTPTKLYFFSFHLKRVYIIRPVDLVAALDEAQARSFPVVSKPWKAFFICRPNAPAVVDPEPSQAAFLSSLPDLYPVLPFNWFEWLEDYQQELAFGALGFMVAITLILYGKITGLYSWPWQKKKRKQQQRKRKTTTTSERTAEAESASLGTSDSLKNSVNTGKTDPSLGLKFSTTKSKSLSLKKKTTRILPRERTTGPKSKKTSTLSGPSLKRLTTNKKKGGSPFESGGGQKLPSPMRPPPSSGLKSRPSKRTK